MVRKDQIDKKFRNFNFTIFTEIRFFLEIFHNFGEILKNVFFNQTVAIKLRYMPMENIILNTFYSMQLFRKMPFSRRFFKFYEKT